MSTESKDIVVVGGSYAAVNTAHYIIKFILPALSTPHRVVLVSPTSALYHRIASPRALLSQEMYPDNKAFIPIAPAFSQYSKSQFSFVQGTLLSISPTNHTLTLSISGAEESRPYHALILATGARSQDPVLSSQGGPQDEITSALKEMHSRLTNARTIVVGGGGPAGVEAASEIGEYLNGKPGWFSSKPRKVTIRLITGAERLLPVLRPALGKQAENMIRDLGVDTTYNTRITGTSRLADGRTRIELGNGETLEADVYINAIGTVPMTGYAPQEWLDEKKRVKVDKTLRVAGAERVYAVGDVHDHTRGGMLDLYDSIPVLATNLKTDLRVAEGGKAQHGDREFEGHTDETQVVTIGQSKGIGAFNGMKLPSVMIWGLKGRDYMSGMTKDAVEGRKWKKEVAWKATPLKAA
ncbi:Pyridine nucleotide-disulfide oxidoreductase-like protein 18 [Elsinoe fawcettii]|nr:Pyridine nucleotide-disulfide oxidoreductase-like protein 18 [Elsinoe fawcettii]